jgi:hypothetical protein
MCETIALESFPDGWAGAIVEVAKALRMKRKLHDYIGGGGAKR